MPIKIPNRLPATQILKSENIFVMNEKRASRQDIRPLRIVILNLMPTKIVTETQLLRLLSNSPLQTEVDLLCTDTYRSKNTPAEHLTSFYCTFSEIKNRKYDGMIITGAPVEHLNFEDVQYWEELKEIMEWSKTNVTSTFHICWAAQAALFYHYHIPKYELPEKCFGVFEHRVKTKSKKQQLLKGFDDRFWIPHSRHTEVRAADIEAVPELQILSVSEEVGVYLVSTRDGRQIFATGHAEYDRETLASEYFRDKDRGLPIAVPKHYFPNDDPKKKPTMQWRAHANLLFSNWLNYYVYQMTPYDLEEIQ